MKTVNQHLFKQPQPLNVELMKLINGKLKHINWELHKNKYEYKFICFTKKLYIKDIIRAKSFILLAKKIVKYFNKY